MRLVISTSILIALLPFSAHAGGLEYVKQVIYGMDCAPCAYGIEQGLKRLSGVEQVKVSLNDGYAEVHLGGNSRATLADIRDVIRKNGFTPKTADVQVSGNVAESNGQFVLKTDVETFELDAPDKSTLSQLAQTDSSVTVTGSVALDNDQALSVSTID